LNDASKACDDARAKLGLPALEKPAAVQKAIQNEKGG
jgi:hypothetical protein